MCVVMYSRICDICECVFVRRVWRACECVNRKQGKFYYNNIVNRKQGKFYHNNIVLTNPNDVELFFTVYFTVYYKGPYFKKIKSLWTTVIFKT